MLDHFIQHRLALTTIFGIGTHSGINSSIHSFQEYKTSFHSAEAFTVTLHTALTGSRKRQEHVDKSRVHTGRQGTVKNK